MRNRGSVLRYFPNGVNCRDAHVQRVDHVGILGERRRARPAHFADHHPYGHRMSLPPDHAHVPDPHGAAGPPPQQKLVTISFDWSQLPSVATAFGVSLVGAAVSLSSVHSRGRGHLDWSNFTMGVLATLGLLGVAAGAHLLLPSSERRAVLVSWPGAAGAVGAGLMIGVLVNDDPWSLYLGASLVVALSVVGYLFTRSAPFVLGAIVGLALLYGQVFGDLIDLSGDGDNLFMIIGAAIVVFVVLVTAAGWLLPETRVLSGVVVGAGGLAAMVALLEALTIARAFTTAFMDAGEFDDGTGTDGFETVMRHNPYENDVYMVLVYVALLGALWTACALASGHVGFKILVASSWVVVLPLATVALITRHPTWWEVGACALGAVVLVGVALRMRADQDDADDTARVQG